MRMKREEGRGKREEVRGLLALTSSLLASSLLAQQGYTNHAGNVIAGWPVKLTATQVTLSEEVRGQSEEVSPDSSLPAPRSTLPAPISSLQPPRSSLYPLSIFPESEQRRIAADFGTPRLPPAVKRAIDGAEKAMARSRKRAEKGLCTKEESEAFCAKSSAALRTYLDKQVESGAITPAERKAVGR